ncbi:MAG: hypothetical protein K8S98_11125 [Planctomycetes bacterium]|nr:hypothetical protein [Planctomycetota bacterium]
MRIAVLIASKNRPERVDALAARLQQSSVLPYDLYVVECGTEREKFSAHSNLWVAEGHSEAYAKGIALQAAELAGKYDYYFVLSNAIELDADGDPLGRLIEQMESEPRMAILAPTTNDGRYPGSARMQPSGWHAVATCEDLGYLVRASAIAEVGFLDPTLEHRGGGIDEYAYRLYSRAWFLAYSDEVTCRRATDLPMAAVPRRALQSALDGFRKVHGERWHEVFWAATRRHEIEIDTFSMHAERWEQELELGLAEPRATLEFGIATNAAFRVFAWPDWRDAHEVEQLLERFARPLVGRNDACLCLRRDPNRDPIPADVLATLGAAHARVLGADAAIEVLIVDDALDASAWPELERAITVAVALPSSSSGERAALYAALGRKVAHTVDALRTHFSGATQVPEIAPALPRYGKDALSEVDWPIVEAIKALHPWFYPVVLGNLKVTPGVGSHVAADFLEHRTACRTRLLVDEVANRIELRGKSVLELACNCAFWSARYAERGATRVVGLEGREEYVRQAELYWSTNRFLPAGAYEFLRGNISDASAWQALRERAPFDVTLCAGILYHVPNYREILRWAAEVTSDVLIVDTRVSDADETPIEEPGELFFNAIRETRVKIVPNRARLLTHLRELGFAAEVLPVGFPASLGVDDVDSYADGRAVTILARRVAVPTQLEHAPRASSSPV